MRMGGYWGLGLVLVMEGRIGRHRLLRMRIATACLEAYPPIFLRRATITKRT